MTTPPWKIVSERQLKDGWMQVFSDPNDREAPQQYRRREYAVIRKNDDGTYTVRNPELQVMEEAASGRLL